MSRHKHHEIASLVDRCRAGDKDAWQQLIKKVMPLVFSICHSLRVSREDSLDIFGQVCYRLLTNMDHVRAPEKLLSYVGTTTRNEVFMMNRHARLVDYFEELDSSSPVADPAVRPDAWYERARRHEELMAAMILLPERDYRLLWTLFFDHPEPDYKRASEVLGIPVASIGPTRARSLAKLRRILEERGFEY